MLADLTPTLLPFLAVVIAAIVTGYFAVKAKRPDTAVSLIEAMQKRQDKQDNRMERLESTNRMLANYVGRLRTHIDEGGGPPAPEWPDELLRALNGSDVA